MSRSTGSKPGRLRTALRQIHPVDKSLLFFMALLLAQSAYSIVCSGDSGPGEIDVIVRTTLAAIFGYFLSANFAGRMAGTGQTPSVQTGHILETGSDTPSDTNGLKAQIGFAADDPQPQSGGVQTDSQTAAGDSAAGNLQVAVATGIGLFCLVVLLVLRNLAHWGIVLVESDSVTATVIQFRDFVSGCIGFLIGSPTQNNSQTS